MLPACRSIDCVSVLALTVADAALVLATIEGDDAGDAYSDFRTGPAAWSQPLRIGIPAAPQFDAGSGYAEGFDSAKARVQALGHQVVAIDFAPLHAVAELLYSGPWVAERHAVVQRLLEDDPAALDPSVRRVVEGASAFSATDAFRGQYRLREAQRSLRSIWQQVDLLMVPTAPGHPRHSDIDAEPLAANARLGTYTNFVNLLGWCALALPSSMTAQGLPFGVTFIAPAAADAALARFGAAWQDAVALPLGATGRAQVESAATPNAPWPASQPTLPIAVVGAHLSGLPLNGQLIERGATLQQATTTAPHYRLYALPNTTPPKPGMVRVAEGGAAIPVEVWEVPLAQSGRSWR